MRQRVETRGVGARRTMLMAFMLFAVIGMTATPAYAASASADVPGIGAVVDRPTLSLADGLQAVASPGTASGLTGRADAVKAQTRADSLLKQAKAARRAHLYTRARALYERARALYLKAGDARRARICLIGMQDLYLIMGTYPYTRAAMLDLLARTYPASTPQQREGWLSLKSTEAVTYDGSRHYFSSLPDNLAFRDVELFQSQPALMAGYRQGYATLVPYLAKAAAANPWQPYAVPTTYTFTQALAVPRNVLPATGDMSIWLPLPVEGGPQTDVQLSDMTPTTWLAYPPSLSQDISLLNLRVPLAQLSGDLDFSVRVSFKHAAQYFKVDPASVGRYDKDSSLYRQYTASRGNTAVTPSIRRTARRVVGGETNPYLAAKRLYDYILDNVTYSFMPHLALWPRGIRESVYVHTRKYGDCGAQSMYFAALCRSIGIPARTTGGFQLFKGVPAGHFWAEFYLPNYGWLPVDPTAAEVVDYLPEVSAADKQAFHDFFFGNQDDLRLTVQKDVDVPLIPRANGRVALPLAIQMPAALCDSMTDVPTLVLNDYWTYK